MREDLRVLSLERTPERLAQFRQINPHVPVIVQKAVDGKTVDRSLYPGLKHSDGALGCLLSHLAFWDEVIALDRPLTIFEDDAIVHRYFLQFSRHILNTMPKGWQFCAWGFNFNALLMFDMVPGAACAVQCEEGLLRHNAYRFPTSRFTPNAVKLYRSWGTVGYALSPAGAAFLRNKRSAFTTDCSLSFPDLKRTVWNVGVDVMLNAFYPTIEAFVCIPPLVITTQDDSTIGPVSGER